MLLLRLQYMLARCAGAGEGLRHLLGGGAGVPVLRAARHRLPAPRARRHRAARQPQVYIYNIHTHTYTSITYYAQTVAEYSLIRPPS